MASIPWEEIEAGTVDLARELTRAHISVSLDGIQAQSLWMLPRGAVHSAWGEGTDGRRLRGAVYYRNPPTLQSRWGMCGLGATVILPVRKALLSP